MEEREQLSQTMADLRAAQAGDGEAANRLWKRYYDKLVPKVRKTLGPRLRQKVETLDILQSVFLEAVSDAGGREFPSEGHFHSWLNKLVESRIKKKSRFFAQLRRDSERERPMVTGPGGEAVAQGPPVPRPVSIVEQLDQEEQLERALERLPAGTRELLVMRYFDELSHAEIGSRIGKSEEAARKLVTRAIELLEAGFRERD